MNNLKDHKFVGVDISKTSFDVCFFDTDGQLVQQQISQDPKEYQEFTSAIGSDAICVMWKPQAHIIFP